MLLGFKDQFHPMILEGSKTHTIRGERKITPKPGEICHCYGKVRQKEMHLLGRWPCVRVEKIRIWLDKGDSHLRDGAPQGAGAKLSDVIVTRRAEEWPFCVQVEINGERLSPDERNELAWRDGFRNGYRAGAVKDQVNCFELMVAFWRKEHGKGKPLDFRGVIIHWDFNRPKAATR